MEKDIGLYVCNQMVTATLKRQFWTTWTDDWAGSAVHKVNMSRGMQVEVSVKGQAHPGDRSSQTSPAIS